MLAQNHLLRNGQCDELEAPERRSDARVPADDPALMRVIGPDCSALRNVRVLDVSKEGFKLLVPQPLDPGSKVQIRLNAVIVLTEVRYCVLCCEGYHAGVLIWDAFSTLAITHRRANAERSVGRLPDFENSGGDIVSLQQEWIGVPTVEPTNTHEEKIALIVETKAAENSGKLAFSSIRDVVELLDFLMSRSDSEFLVRYVQWRRDHPTANS